MASVVTRRQLFRADPSGRRPVVRPPWATAHFHTLCTRCNDCLPACPENILVIGDGGFPEIDFKRGECTFCADCVIACKPAALSRADRNVPPWHHVVRVTPDCLEASGVHCHACVDPCPDAVIRFPPGLGWRGLPEIDHLRCTGCGACIAPCPVAAIHVHVPSTPRMEVTA